ncbi:metacaspase-1-like [Aristolochia californica]|uniref:metacaspase-1-like n=1 Tax=Aristolochia californica TaxID=171875 RepID=UPI0035D71255
MACVNERDTTVSYSQCCTQCGQYLLVPAYARMVKCSECLTMNPVRSHDSISRVQDQVKKTASLVKGYMQKLSTDMNFHSSYSSSSMYPNQYGSQTSHGYSGSNSHLGTTMSLPYGASSEKPCYGTAHSYGSSENAHHGTANSQAYGSSGSTHQGVGQPYSHGSSQYAHQGTSLSQSHGSSQNPYTCGSSPSSPHGAIVPHSYGQMNSHQEGHHQNSPHQISRVSNSYGSYTISQSPVCPPVHGKKRAVLCGVSYKYRRYELKGTVNDVNCMKYLLCNKFSFSDECILVLTEDDKNPSRTPTKQNILSALRWLVHGSQSGDSLFFHFSGHGSQQVDVSGDEADGYDEVLCPMDYETEGNIVDDEINETIVRPLPKGAKLHAIIDACHSGTALDLPFVCKMNRAGFYDWVNESTPYTYKGTRGGLAISFSSCNDQQTSADTSAFSVNTTTGAMTYCFIQAVESEPGVSYGRLLNVMRSAIREAQTSLRTSGPIASLLRKMLRTGLTQEPQLSASERFDVYKLPFQL